MLPNNTWTLSPGLINLCKFATQLLVSRFIVWLTNSYNVVLLLIFALFLVSMGNMTSFLIYFIHLHFSSLIIYFFFRVTSCSCIWARTLFVLEKLLCLMSMYVVTVSSIAFHVSIWCTLLISYPDQTFNLLTIIQPNMETQNLCF